MSVRPIGYTDSGEPVWPITTSPDGDCDHVLGWVCNEMGEHTDVPYKAVNALLRDVYAQLAQSEEEYSDTGYFATLPLRRLRADLYMVLGMADAEATDPCVNCDHPVRCHDEGYPSPCMVTNCRCAMYEPGCDDCGRQDGTHDPNIEH